MIDFDKKWGKYLNEVTIFEPDPISLPSFEVKDMLNPAIWGEDGQLQPEIREKLLKIANDFIEDADLGVAVVDVIVTGSNANYNWTKYSDVDLHIVLDFKDIDSNTELVKEMLTQRRINWNLTHDIMIYDHEVEIYLQDVSEHHVSSGIYSVLGDRWVVQPTLDKPRVEMEPVEMKANGFVEKINNVEKLFQEERHYEAYDFAKRLKKKIKKMRQSGLEQGGVYSTENLAFKYLRNTNYLQKLHDFYNMAYDRMLSIEE